MKTYLVGGAVRDIIMGLKPKDYDFVVVGATEQQMLDQGFVRVGASFPVFLKDGHEYALARTERKTGVGYKGFDVVFDPTVTLEDDLIRRDLTINSMAMDLDTNEIIDPFGGQADVKSRILRATSDAFAEDPVRVLRTARFAARYGFHVWYDTLELMRKVAPELNHVPQERIWAEFEKGLAEQHPYIMMEVLGQCDALEVDALLPYRGWSGVLTDITDQDNMEVRFALVARWFDDDDYDLCKIPTHLARVSRSVNKHALHIAGYPRAPYQERLDTLTDLRAFSDRKHVDDVLRATLHMLSNAEHAAVIASVHEDIAKVKAVDLTRAPALAMAAGMPVKDYVNLLRLQAVSA